MIFNLWFIHYLLYSDLFDTEGLISSPWGEGTADDILEVISHYETNFELQGIIAAHLGDRRSKTKR